MNEIKIKDINNVYEILEMAENMGDEITVGLLDAIAVIYHSDILDMFKIDIIDKYKLEPEYFNLSSIGHINFGYYVNVLCNNNRFNYHLDESIS